MDNCPPEVAEFLQSEKPLKDGVRPSGQPGKVGVLNLRAQKKYSDSTQKDGGRTQVMRREVKAPLHITRPLYVDPQNPDQACIYVRSTGGGIAQNDSFYSHIDLDPGAEVFYTTTTATSVYRMNQGIGINNFSANVKEGATLEYFPGHTILFGGSRYVQRTHISLEKGARLLYGDCVHLGRLARGERADFDLYSQTLLVDYCEEKLTIPILNDYSLAGKALGIDPTDPLLFSSYPLWGTFLICDFSTPVDDPHAPESEKRLEAEERTKPGKRTKPNIRMKREEDYIKKRHKNFLLKLRDYSVYAKNMEGDNEQVREVRQNKRETVMGASLLRDNRGLLVRIASYDPEELRKEMWGLYDYMRSIMLHRPAFDPRIM